MTKDHLIEEKTSLQKSLLYYESQHGRPVISPPLRRFAFFLFKQTMLLVAYHRPCWCLHSSVLLSSTVPRVGRSPTNLKIKFGVRGSYYLFLVSRFLIVRLLCFTFFFWLQVTREERHIVKPLYDRYRLVKQMLTRASITPVLVSKLNKCLVLFLKTESHFVAKTGLELTSPTKQDS